jgi:uncharacterized protein
LTSARTRPFVVGVAEQLRHPGTQRELRLTGELDDIAITAARVPGDAPIEANLTIEAMTDHSVTVKGTIAASWAGECRRCLRPVTGTAVAEVEEIFDARPVEGETYPLEGDRLDLEPMVRDAVLLSLPLAPLCEDACAGPEPEHHPIGTADDAGGDPRWAALKELKFD